MVDDGLTPPTEWIIDDIMPANELHIIAGPSGGGKTTLNLQFLEALKSGGQFFGHQCHSHPFVYVSLDRGEASLKRTLRRCGVDPGGFPYLAAINLPKPPKTFLELVDAIVARFPGQPIGGMVWVIEGIGRLAPAGHKANDYHATADFVAWLSAFCNQQKLTIIGIMHSPKTKEGEGYKNARQRILSSVAWGGYSETIILTEPHDHDPLHLRVISLLPRNAAEEMHIMQLSEHGTFEHYAEPKTPVEEAKDKKHVTELLDEWLEALPGGTMFSKAELNELAKKMFISEKTVDRWIDTCLAGMFIKRLSKGLYQKPESQK